MKRSRTAFAKGNEKECPITKNGFDWLNIVVAVVGGVIVAITIRWMVVLFRLRLLDYCKDKTTV